MSRRKAAVKRKIVVDPLFKSELVAKFINVVMENGKKAVAEKIVYRAFAFVIGKQTNKENINFLEDEDARSKALEMFTNCLDSLGPTVEIRSRRVGGSTYQVPVEVPAARKIALAMRWLVEFAKKRSEKGGALRLGSEILDAIAGRGGAFKKRETVHSNAKANQAFANL